MKVTWAGTGSALTPGVYQTQAVISCNGKNLLIDCGGDARNSLKEHAGIGADDIDAVYISHLHGDHVHGLEWLGFCRYAWGGVQRLPKPKVYGVDRLLVKLWAEVLRGTLESIEGQVNTFADYFDLRPLAPNESFVWEGLLFEPVQTVHVMNGRALTDSFGLFVTEFVDSKPNNRVFFTTDTQFCPTQINAFYNKADVIFHDCETSRFPSGVHAHYNQLVTLPDLVKAKTYLIHYTPGLVPLEQAQADGFISFVVPGTVIDTKRAEEPA
jgi:ribonuclease BN (tRNA processing enzyme)